MPSAPAKDDEPKSASERTDHQVKTRQQLVKVVASGYPPCKKNKREREVKHRSEEQETNYFDK
jgi:hypothetical protein